MTDIMRFTVLGCGTSQGVPRVDGNWGACDSDNLKNRRRRSSLAVQRIGKEGTTTIVIDTGPDFREQMLSAEISCLDAVLYTHGHADHVHGIDDLRAFALVRRERTNIYADDPTLKRLREGFEYCFVSSNEKMYPPIIKANVITPLKPIQITGQGGCISVLPISQVHGAIHSLGFRFDCGQAGSVCYSSDISDIKPEFESHFKNLDTWILDALQYKSHISHFSLDDALAWVDKLKPRRALLTHMNFQLDYDTVQQQTPDHVAPGYDGLSFELALSS